MLIDCDRAMMKHLLRCWGKNRLRPQGVTLYNERPRLMTIQNGICGCINEAFCPKTPLVNDGKATHLDHIVTVNVFADKVIAGELTFDEAYTQLWDDSNLRAVHHVCNYALARETKRVKESL